MFDEPGQGRNDRTRWAVWAVAAVETCRRRHIAVSDGRLQLSADLVEGTRALGEVPAF